MNRQERISEIWNQSKNRFSYNPVSKSVNFSKKRPTDYKLNKFIHLPKPLNAEGEFFCEMRRRKYTEAFKKYMYLLREKDEKLNKKRVSERKRQLERENKDPTGRSEGAKLKLETVNNSFNSRQKAGIKRNKKLDDSNLSKREKEGLESLKKRVKEQEIVIAQTDKSSRFALMNRTQYLEAGYKHTSKDRNISWKEVKKLQTTTNNHVWWLSRILKYSHDTDRDRMTKNIQDHAAEIPEMVLLVKDHKDWKEDSNKVVPTRPVVSGNNALNTHLSEILSEILEPVALNMKSAEVSSTEETLHKLTGLNDYIFKGNQLEDMNILEDMFKDDEELKIIDVLENLYDENQTEMTKTHPHTESNDISNVSGDDEVTMHEVIDEKKKEICKKRQRSSNKVNDRQTNILDFFGRGEKEKILEDPKWLASMENMFKNAANTNKNDSSSKLRDQVSSGRYWGMRTEREQVGRENCEGLILEGLPTLQEFNETPIFVGGDVEALYPSISLLQGSCTRRCLRQGWSLIIWTLNS